ncbi:polysaccharide biosynthesis/export family protein [bacterium]|nr:polysaccharide biosynthesis/export family protein [bacterium]
MCFNFLKFTSLLFCLLVFTLCFGQEKPAQNQTQSKFFTYKVGNDDVLTIEVYDNSDLSGNYTVSSEGNISFPLLGLVKVSGMSVVEIKRAITEMLFKDYLQNPIVSVTLKDYKSQVVKILGNVGKPGIYYLDSPTRLFDILSRAEGLSPHLGKVVNGQKAHVMRQLTESNGDSSVSKVKTIYVDLYQMLVEGKEGSNIYLRNGDVIYIPEGNLVHVIGEVKKVGSFPFEEGMTVLKAITLAGGTSTKASIKNIMIKRIENGKEIEKRVKMSDLLQPEDIVEVPLSFW